MNELTFQVSDDPTKSLFINLNQGQWYFMPPQVSIPDLEKSKFRELHKNKIPAKKVSG